MIEFSCKKCGQKLNIEDKHSGKRVKCPKCGEAGVVPDNSDKIKFHCENCGQSISVPQIHAGKKGRCPKCKNPVVIPTLKKEPDHSAETFSVVCSMCEEIIEAPKSSRGQTIECPACGSYVEASSGGGPPESAESDPSIPSSTDEDQYEDDFEAPEEGAGLDRRLIFVISGATVVVVVGLIILVTVILPSGSQPVEGPESRRERQEVADADLGHRPVTSDTQPIEPIVQEPARKESLSKKPVSLEDQLSKLTKIAFRSKRDRNFEIYVMNAEGSEQKNLTNNPAMDEGLIWSPDGKRIAFTSYREEKWDIYIMNTDGSEQKNLSNDRVLSKFPSWSPDGRKITFHAIKGGHYDLCVMNADGSEQKNLTNDPSTDLEPSWSPFLSSESQPVEEPES